MKSVLKRPRHRPNRPPHARSQNIMEGQVHQGDIDNGNERLDYRPPRNRAVLQQNIDKYLNQAREAMSSGDRIAAENFLQHADHFNRLLNEQKEIRQQHDNRRVPQKDHSSTSNAEGSESTSDENKSPLNDSDEQQPQDQLINVETENPAE